MQPEYIELGWFWSEGVQVWAWLGEAWGLPSVWSVRSWGFLKEILFISSAFQWERFSKDPMRSPLKVLSRLNDLSISLV